MRSFQRMSRTRFRRISLDTIAPLTIEQLEEGLRVMDEGDVDLRDFWDDHVAAFRQTVLLSIRDTSDALFSSSLPLNWRIELQSQLDDLVRYLGMADRYIARRSAGRPRLVLESSGPVARPN